MDKDVFKLENTKHDLMWQLQRLKTFKKWPHKSGKCDASNMSEAGWYCTSITEDDPSARCPFCFKELNGWESTDDPWDEHRKHSPKCEFVNIGKSENELSTVEMYKLLQARSAKILEMQYQEDLKKLQNLNEKVIEFVNDKKKN